MAYYLVTATLRKDVFDELQTRLEANEFIKLKPFGKVLSRSLRNARFLPDGRAIWEEEDYCSPPLAEERAAVLNYYFDNIEVEKVKEGAGWKRIAKLPKLFPQLD